MSSQNLSKFYLPTNVKPTHYDLTILTDLQARHFEGLVKVSLDVLEETGYAMLNSVDLTLGNCVMIHNGNETTASYDIQAAEKRVRFSFPKVPTDSKIELVIPFKGELTNNMTGYYISQSPQGHTISLTQFEPTDARRAFPCWDEPTLKATFKITMLSRAETVNLSNMPVEAEHDFDPTEVAKSTDSNYLGIAKYFPSLVAGTHGGKWKISHFGTTPLMSSYLVAYANGPLEHLETSIVSPKSGKTIPLRVYATADLIHQAQFALDVKANVLPVYEQVFDVEYPLPKLDTLVASDFDAGAMENWGLITGRTTAYLLDPQNPDIKTKKTIVAVQSHEVAHQWFGNITTMKIFDYLYLNEGFATLMGELIVPNRIYPEYQWSSSFIDEHLSDALALDAKLSSHPIEVACPDPDQIGQIFDSLSYSKAASVLRMLSNHCGEDRFLKGVSLYLKANLYGNTVTKDLWKGISEATGMDISNLMENWITKTGYPIITVTESEGSIHVRQNRFLETGIASPQDDTTIWNVPLSILSVKDGEKTVDNSIVLTEREQTIPLDTTQPFKLNAGTVGVYRVSYPRERLLKIAHEASKANSLFSLGDRIGLIDDVMALAKAGLTELSTALSFVDTLRNEKEYLVWSAISSSLAGLASVWWEDRQVTENLKAFGRSLFTPLVEKLGYDFPPNESPDTVELRRCAISAAAHNGDPRVIAELKSRFEHFLKTGDESRIPGDLQRVVYITAVRHGGKEIYDAMLKIHQDPPSPAAGVTARYALASSLDSELLKRTFDTILNGSRAQDCIYFFRGLADNTAARRMTPEFFKKEYEKLETRNETTFVMKSLVQYSFAPLSTKKDLDETRAFFKTKDTARYHMALDQTFDSIHSKIQYIERSTGDLSSWLNEWSSRT